jgi:hypothetical protein
MGKLLRYQKKDTAAEQLAGIQQDKDVAEEFGETFKRLEARIEKLESSGVPQEKMTPQQLYGYIPESGGIARKLVHFYDSVTQALHWLTEAKEQYEDELARESAMNSFTQAILQLNIFIGINQSLNNCICALHTAIYAHLTHVYSKGEIYGLKKALLMIRDKPLMSEEYSDSVLDILENEGFDLSAPFTGIEL